MLEIYRELISSHHVLSSWYSLVGLSMKFIFPNDLQQFLKKEGNNSMVINQG